MVGASGPSRSPTETSQRAARRDVEDRVHLAVDVDAALERLQRVDARACRVVELKFYGGLEDTQISEALGVTTRTVRRDWVKAQAHLRVFVGGRSTVSRSIAA